MSKCAVCCIRLSIKWTNVIGKTNIACFVQLLYKNNRLLTGLFPIKYFTARRIGEGYCYPKTQKNKSKSFLYCEQALCLGKGWKNRGEREVKGCQQSVFQPIAACIRICFTAGAVERRSQMFVYGLSPFTFPLLMSFSFFPQTKSLFTGYGACNMRVKRVWITGHSKSRSPLLFSSFYDISLKK